MSLESASDPNDYELVSLTLKAKWRYEHVFLGHVLGLKAIF